MIALFVFLLILILVAGFALNHLILLALIALALFAVAGRSRW